MKTPGIKDRNIQNKMYMPFRDYLSWAKHIIATLPENFNETLLFSLIKCYCPQSHTYVLILLNSHEFDLSVDTYTI